eukprot:Nk52_evm9s262 gene=Nk52_evmTU9s262
MDPEREKDLLWIAKEGLKAPLPEGWKPCQTEEGEIYYFNFTDGRSIWEHPCDDYYREVYEDEKRKRAETKSSKKQSSKSKKKEGVKSLAPLKSEKEIVTLNPISAKSKLAPVKTSKGLQNNSAESSPSIPQKVTKIPVSQTVLGESLDSPSGNGKGPELRLSSKAADRESPLGPLKNKNAPKQGILKNAEKTISSLLTEQAKEIETCKSNHLFEMEALKKQQDEELRVWKEKKTGEHDRQKDAISIQKKMELEQLRKFYAGEREKIKAKLTEENKKELEEIKKKLAESVKIQEKELLDLKKQQESVLAKAKEDSEKTLEKVKDDDAKEIESVKKSFEKQKADLNKQHKESLERLTNANGKEIMELSESHKALVKDLKEKNQSEIQEVEKQLGSSVGVESASKLNKEKKSLDMEMGMLKKKHDSAMAAEVAIFEKSLNDLRADHEKRLDEARVILEKEFEERVVEGGSRAEADRESGNDAKENIKDILNSSFRKLSEGEVEDPGKGEKRPKKFKEVAPVFEKTDSENSAESLVNTTARIKDARKSSEEFLERLSDDPVLKSAAELKKKLNSQNKKILRAKTYLKREKPSTYAGSNTYGNNSGGSESSSDGNLHSVISYPLLQRVKQTINNENAKLNLDFNRSGSKVEALGGVAPGRSKEERRFDVESGLSSSSDIPSSSDLDKNISYVPYSDIGNSIAGIEAGLSSLRPFSSSHQNSVHLAGNARAGGDDRVYTALMSIENDLKNLKDYLALNSQAPYSGPSVASGDLNASFAQQGSSTKPPSEHSFSKGTPDNNVSPSDHNSALDHRWKSRLDANINELHKTNQQTLDRYKTELYGSSHSVASSLGRQPSPSHQQFLSPSSQSLFTSGYAGYSARKPYSSSGSFIPSGTWKSSQSRVPTDIASGSYVLKENVDWLKEFRSRMDIRPAALTP